MKAPLIHVAGMIFDQPHAILPEKLDVILRALGPRLAIDAAVADIELQAVRYLTVGGGIVNVNGLPYSFAPGPVISAEVGVSDQPVKNDKPYRLTTGGVAVIPVRGTLMKRFSYLSAASGCSSYAALGDAAAAAFADPAVKAVLFDCDSPGGTTHGCFELSEQLYNMRGDKPMWALANDLAASAAYALASAADRVLVTRTAGVGSIGVFALHADQSGADEQAGVKYTYVSAGDKKTDGNPHEPLSKSARGDIQAEVDREYAMFVAAVARNRAMTAQAVKKTEAAVYYGDNAIGDLADEVATYDEALSMLTAKVNAPARTISLASQTNVSDNPGNAVALPPDEHMPAIAPHKTATSDGAWDGPKAEKNLRQGEAEGYYRKAYAYQDPGGDATTKAAYKFIHHEVSGDGDVGAANIKACQTSIGVLNGGRGGTVLTGADRRGVYKHVAAHLRDAKLEPAPLASKEAYLAEVLEYALESGNAALHAKALEYLQADDAETRTGDEEMLDPNMKRAAAEDDEAQAKKAQDDNDDDDEDDKKKKKDDDGDDDDEDARKGKRGKAKKDDDEDDAKARRGRVTEMPLAANEAAARIAKLCIMQGVPEMAAEYIAAGFTVDKVIDDLSKRRAKASEENRVDSYVSGETQSAQVSVERAIRQAATVATNSGCTPENFAATRYKALTQILRRDPRIYESYMQERDRVIAQCPSGTGPAITKYVMQTQSRYMMLLDLSSNLGDVPKHATPMI